jgi:transcriptional regulator with XRE-family HTH domain
MIASKRRGSLSHYPEAFSYKLIIKLGFRAGRSTPASDVGRLRPHTTAEIDRFVGMRIRERRTALGMTQRELAQALRVALPTLPKYGQGSVSLSASRFYEIARHLSASPDYFFEGFEERRSAELPVNQRLLLSFMHSVSEIDSEAHWEVLSHLVRGLAGS